MDVHLPPTPTHHPQTLPRLLRTCGRRGPQNRDSRGRETHTPLNTNQQTNKRPTERGPGSTRWGGGGGTGDTQRDLYETPRMGSLGGLETHRRGPSASSRCGSASRTRPCAGGSRCRRCGRPCRTGAGRRRCTRWPRRSTVAPPPPPDTCCGTDTSPRIYLEGGGKQGSKVKMHSG